MHAGQSNVAVDYLKPEGDLETLSARKERGERSDHDQPQRKRQAWAWVATKERSDWMDSYASFLLE